MTHVTSFIFGYLLNSLWQAPLLLAAAWLAARLASRQSPAWEHRTWVIALCAQILLPFVNISPVRWQQLRELIFWPTSHQSAKGSIRVFVGPANPAQPGLLHLPFSLMAALELIYGAALLFAFARFAWHLRGTFRLLRASTDFAAVDQIQETFLRCREEAGLTHQNICLRTSSSIPGPVTAGIRRHMVLVPPAFLESLTAVEREATLHHEFAHVRRHDFARNLIYQVLALPCAWHPALWLTRSRLAESRELVCDAMAARATGGPQQYAHSLLRLVVVQSNQRPVSIHALGLFESHALERRIMKLTQIQIKSSLTHRLLTLTACAAMGLITCGSAMALHLNTAPVTHVMLSEANPVHISPGVMSGQRISGKEPVYPAEAKKKHIEGDVILKAVISKEGSIEKLHTVSGPPILAASALKAVRTWRYKPYLLNGQPVTVETEIHVIYNLGSSK